MSSCKQQRDAQQTSTQSHPGAISNVSMQKHTANVVLLTVQTHKQQQRRDTRESDYLFAWKNDKGARCAHRAANVRQRAPHC